jgi:hypothetical protein
MWAATPGISAVCSLGKRIAHQIKRAGQITPVT